jgi:hypothetical protein
MLCLTEYMFVLFVFSIGLCYVHALWHVLHFTDSLQSTLQRVICHSGCSCCDGLLQSGDISDFCLVHNLRNMTEQCELWVCLVGKLMWGLTFVAGDLGGGGGACNGTGNSQVKDFHAPTM